MKRILVVLLLITTLSGCSGEDDHLARGMALRERLLQTSCTFDTVINADYGEKTYTFSMRCQSDPDGKLTFTVTEPDTIAGITGNISGTGGHLTFDDTVLTFPLLADGEASPISAPWLMFKSLYGGYLSTCGMEGEYLQLTIHDSYEEDALQVDVWLGNDDLPVRADILWQGRRVLSLSVENFAFV